MGLVAAASFTVAEKVERPQRGLLVRRQVLRAVNAPEAVRVEAVIGHLDARLLFENLPRLVRQAALFKFGCQPVA